MTAVETITSPADLPTMEVEGLHLSVTRHYPSGSSHNTHVLENGDLGVKDNARDLLRSCVEGQIVVALGVDGDHDEVHYSAAVGETAIETLRRSREAIEVALSALERTRRA